VLRAELPGLQKADHRTVLESRTK